MNEPEKIEPAFGLVLGGIFAGAPFMGALLAAAVILLLIILNLMQRLRKKLGKARALLEKMAMTDDLTGVLNRSHLLARFEEEFHEHRRQKTERGPGTRPSTPSSGGPRRLSSRRRRAAGTGPIWPEDHFRTALTSHNSIL